MIAKLNLLLFTIGSCIITNKEDVFRHTNDGTKQFPTFQITSNWTVFFQGNDEVNPPQLPYLS